MGICCSLIIFLLSARELQLSQRDLPLQFCAFIAHLLQSCWFKGLKTQPCQCSVVFREVAEVDHIGTFALGFYIGHCEIKSVPLSDT